MNNKQCSKCKEVKHIDEFYKDKRTQSGLKSECKKCHILQNKEYNKAYQIENKDKLSEYNKKFDICHETIPSEIKRFTPIAI